MSMTRKEHCEQRTVVFAGLMISIFVCFCFTLNFIDKKAEEIKAEIRAAAKAGAPSAK
jgi:hypothetical protein